jgi:hypothetical protein
LQGQENLSLRIPTFQDSVGGERQR